MTFKHIIIFLINIFNSEAIFEDDTKAAKTTRLFSPKTGGVTHIQCKDKEEHSDSVLKHITVDNHRTGIRKECKRRNSVIRELSRH